LLEEVTFLSARNSQVEEQIASLPSLQDEIKVLKKTNDALLVLVGEKDEEVETIFSDLKEVKTLYRDQIAELLNKIVPPFSGPSS
jgi:hypothetical protein